MSNNNKKEIYVTPKGIGKYMRVLVPDTKFNPDGTYQASICLKKAEAKDLCKMLKKQYDDAQKPKKKAGKPPFFINDDGDVEIKFAQKSIIRAKSTGEEFKKTVAILDGKQRPCRPNVGDGSTIRISFSTRPYDYNGCGISLDLIAVQVLKLVEWTPEEKEFGFEDEEDGFEASDEYDADGNPNPPQRETGFEEATTEDTSDEEDQEDDLGESDGDDSPF